MYIGALYLLSLTYHLKPSSRGIGPHVNHSLAFRTVWLYLFLAFFWLSVASPWDKVPSDFPWILVQALYFTLLVSLGTPSIDNIARGLATLADKAPLSGHWLLFFTTALAFLWLAQGLASLPEKVPRFRQRLHLFLLLWFGLLGMEPILGEIGRAHV